MSLEVSNIDHLGLVAGIIDEIGIEQKINQLRGSSATRKNNRGSSSQRNALKWVRISVIPTIFPIVDFLKEKL